MHRLSPNTNLALHSCNVHELFGTDTMRPPMLFLAGCGVGFVVVAYTSFVPPDSATSTMHLASPETDYMDCGEQARNILFLISAGVALLAAIMAFLKPRVAA